MRKSKRLRTLIKQAKMGKPHAMYALGLRYLAGREVPRDRIEALLWIRGAAEAGYRPAVLWLRDTLFDDDARVQAEA